MVYLLLGIGLLVAAALFGMLLQKKREKATRGTGKAWPYYAKRPLSPPEQVLYHRLVKALPDHIVLAQVQVSRVLGVKKGADFNAWNNRINRLSYDFVVCAKDSTVLGAIELDDKSHAAPARQEADQRKDRASNAAGITLIRLNVASLPDERHIRSFFLKPVPSVAEALAASPP